MIKWIDPKVRLPKEREWPIGSWQANTRSSKLVAVAVEDNESWLIRGFKPKIRVTEGFYSYELKQWQLQGYSGNFDDRVMGWTPINKPKYLKPKGK